jgi:hypothetical protein
MKLTNVQKEVIKMLQAGHKLELPIGANYYMIRSITNGFSVKVAGKTFDSLVKLGLTQNSTKNPLTEKGKTIILNN